MSDGRMLCFAILGGIGTGCALRGLIGHPLNSLTIIGLAVTWMALAVGLGWPDARGRA